MEEGSSVQDVTNTSLAELRKLLLHRLLEEKKKKLFRGELQVRPPHAIDVF